MIEPSSAFSSRSDEVVAGILGKAGTLRAGVSKGPPASTEVAVLDARWNAGKRRYSCSQVKSSQVKATDMNETLIFRATQTLRFT